MKKIIITAMAGNNKHDREVYGLAYLSGTGSDIPTPLEQYCHDRAREGVDLAANGLDIGCGLNRSPYRLALNAAQFVAASPDFGLALRTATIGMHPVVVAIANIVNKQAAVVSKLSEEIRELKKTKAALAMAEVFGGLADVAALSRINKEIVDKEEERKVESVKLAKLRDLERVESEAVLTAKTGDLERVLIAGASAETIREAVNSKDDEKTGVPYTVDSKGGRRYYKRFSIPSVYAVRSVFASIAGKDAEERINKLVKVCADNRKRLDELADIAARKAADIAAGV